MAGINIVLSEGGLLSQKTKLFKTLESLNYLNNFNSHIFLLEDRIFIGWNRYEEYPIQQFPDEKYLVLLEGKIYNRTMPEIGGNIGRITKAIEDKDYIFLREWLKRTDGDFIFYLFDKTEHKLFIINDILGRIPIYYTNSSGRTIISRHLKFITEIVENYQFDRTAFAEFIFMGFMLGQRTLINNVNQVEPASLISVTDGDVKKIKLYDFNFDVKLHKDKSFSQNIKNISDLFSESVINRFGDSEKNILALSGGVDSRVVAACLFKNKIEFTSVSMLYSTGHEAKDLEIAKKVSELFDVEWRALEISPPIGSDLIEVLSVKEGMNSLATSAILNFYKKIKENFGNRINYITGDNGDKLIFTLDRPLVKFNNIGELVDYTIKDRVLLPLEKIKQLLNFDENDVYEDLNSMFNSYPEVNLAQKFIHFRVLEKPFKYAFQGEDRHRNYFWNVSPFWSFPFYDYLMNCPDEMKKRHKTFRSWMQSYSKEATELEYTKFRSSITSVRGKLFMSFVYNFYPHIPLSMKHLLKRLFFREPPLNDIYSPLIQSIMSQKNKKPVSDYFLIPDSDVLIKNRKIILFDLLTLSSAIEFLKSEEISLSKFSDSIYY